MAEELDDGEFWLPSQFLTDDDILMDFKSDFGTASASASASTSDLTSLTSDDDDILLPAPTRELSGSPQSTLCSWPTGPVSPKKEHPKDSLSLSVPVPVSVSETDSKDNATLDLLNKAACEVAKINININNNNGGKIGTGFFDCSNTGKRLSCPPPIQQRPLLFYPPPFYSHPQFRRFPPHMMWGPVQYAPPQQIKQSRVNKGSNASINGKANNNKTNSNGNGNGNGNNSERPLGLPPSAWPPLPGQAQTQAQQPEPQPQPQPQPQAQPNMGMFVGHKIGSVGTGVFLPRRVSTADPKKKSGALDDHSLKLYTLIWARTMACQMEAAKVDQIQLDIGNANGSISFQAACSTISFPGFRSVYEGTETKAIGDTETEPSVRDEFYEILSNLKQGNQLFLGNIKLQLHHTQPPPRYSEASLVKKLEELGIGTPSTYAGIIKVLQDRKYVKVKSRVIFPEFRGRMVSAFLSHYVNELTDYSFTTDMQTELDNVSGGLTEWKGFLKDYWSRFSTYCDCAGKVNIRQVEKMLERTFNNFLFSSLKDEARTCPSCLEGTLIFKTGRFGAGYFISCDQHPKCKFIAPRNSNSVEEPKLLGTHPASGEKVLLKFGPYGASVQLGEYKKGYSSKRDRKRYLPKRASVPRFKDVNSITLEDALDFLRYPISLGKHPVDGQPVLIRISRGGFNIRHRRKIAPIPKDLPRNDITMDKAVELLSPLGDRCSNMGPTKR